MYLALRKNTLLIEMISTYVWVKKGEKIEKKYIELGISDGKYTEITQGLTKDDKIVQNDSAN